MKNKTLEFVKNMTISSVPFILGGVAGAELSDLVTDNETVISSVSTASQYVTAYPIFLALHAHDNKEVYKKEGIWNRKMLLVDTVKMTFTLGIAEVAYIAGRTGIMDYLLNRDFSPTPAAVTADLICIPLYMALAIPLAKRFGIIKE